MKVKDVKHKVTLDDFEHRLLVGCVNVARTMYLEQNKPTEDVDDLLFKIINQRVGSLIKAAHGSAGLQHVTRGVFEATLVPLPPLAEQHRIVQRIEELLPMVQGL